MKLPLLVMTALVAILAPAREEKDKATLELGRARCAQFDAGKLTELWEQFDEGLQKVLGSLDNLKTFHEQVRAQLGAQVSVVDETVQPQGSTRVYVRTSRFEKMPAVIETVFGFDEKQKVSTFLVRPVPKEAPSEFLDYETKSALRLPFDGEWTVFWGGRKLAENYHAATEDQRFAYDIVIVRDGSTHAGDGKRNEDYHCFGLPIAAPAKGVVVVATDGVEENVPGKSTPGHPAGNRVVLDHENGEFSMLAHFRKGSLVVKKGDRVDAGTVLGKCGNSGNSSEPHLHYHLQNTSEFLDGKGLPAQFQNYVADGKEVARGEPVKGQRIRNP